jgi:hypothetical protein
MAEKLILPESLKPPKPRAKALGMIALYGLAFSFGTLGLWLKLSSLSGSSLSFGVAFFAVVSLATVIGGLWWGAVVRSEAALLEPLLCATLFGGMAILLGLGHFLPEETGAFRSYLYPALFFPCFFLWGSAPAFLTSLAFPKDRGTSRGLFTLFALALFSLSLGLLISALWNRLVPLKNIWVVDLSALLAAFLVIWLWITRPRQAEDLPFRFWPTRSLGYFTIEPSHGQELLVYSRAASTLKPASFLGALAAGAALLWVCPNGPPLPSLFSEVWGPLFLVPVTLALGALVLGPALAFLASPMMALCLDLLLLSLYLAFIPEIREGGGVFLGFGAPLFIIGALWPLSARVGVSSKGFLPLSLGSINFWLLLGFVLGLIGALVLDLPRELLVRVTAYLTLAAAFLAAAPQLSWIFTGVLALIVGILYYFI